MALVFGWWLTDLTVAILTLLIGLYLYMRYVFSYWEKRGVAFLEPSFPFGNIADAFLLRKHMGLVFADIYARLEGHKVGGLFQLHRPTLLLRDPDVIKNFLVKDFARFQDRGIYFDETNDPISAHLFFMGGSRWKTLRAKMTPTFTSGKMKMMFDEILKCGQELTECVQRCNDGGEVIEVKDLIARYSTDVIATCAFGIQCNCLNNPDAEFRQKGKDFFNPSFFEGFGGMLNVMSPSLAAVLKLGLVPKHISSFFRNIVKETVEYREKNNVVRKDFMQLLVQLKNKGIIEGEGGSNPKEQDQITKLSLDEISAQAFVFFLAGFETSSTTVSFCLYELALNQNVQTRLRTEIDAVLEKHGGTLTYDAMMDMEYLNMVIDETLRMYPALPFLNRECNSAHKMAESGVLIEPGTLVIVPVYGLHYDPKFYPEPKRFDPERFTREEKAKRNKYTFLPFGEGPRACIGERFGYMQAKVALVSLIARFEFKVSEKTMLNQEFNPRGFTIMTKGGLFLDIVNRA